MIAERVGEGQKPGKALRAAEDSPATERAVRASLAKGKGMFRASRLKFYVIQRRMTGSSSSHTFRTWSYVMMRKLHIAVERSIAMDSFELDRRFRAYLFCCRPDAGINKA
jgi:hypothetical protein